MVRPLIFEPTVKGQKKLAQALSQKMCLSIALLLAGAGPSLAEEYCYKVLAPAPSTTNLDEVCLQVAEDDNAYSFRFVSFTEGVKKEHHGEAVLVSSYDTSTPSICWWPKMSASQYKMKFSGDFAAVPDLSDCDDGLFVLDMDLASDYKKLQHQDHKDCLYLGKTARLSCRGLDGAKLDLVLSLQTKASPGCAVM